jgi:CheY-like chemotaxis protein
MNELKTDSFEENDLYAMVIDNDEFQIDFVVCQLESMGISRIATADSGASALAIFDKAQPKPDFLICDIQMPDIDGFAIMQALEERNYTGGVILMSGQGERVLHSASLVARLVQQDFLDSIEKPVRKEDLAKAIKKMIAGR